MSLSIPLPNYTQIPNILLDEWMCKLKPSAFMTLMCICRKTFGWHKASDNISISQLIKMSGMAKQTVLNSIEELLENNLIIKIKNKLGHEHQSTNYSLNIIKPVIEEDPEGIVQNLDGGGSLNYRPGVVQNLDQGVVQNLDQQKKELKETIQKKLTPSAGGSFSPTEIEKPIQLKKYEEKFYECLSDPILDEVLTTEQKRKAMLHSEERCLKALQIVKENKPDSIDRYFFAALIRDLNPAATEGNGKHKDYEANMKQSKELEAKSNESIFYKADPKELMIYSAGVGIKPSQFHSIDYDQNNRCFISEVEKWVSLFESESIAEKNRMKKITNEIKCLRYSVSQT